MLVYDPTASTLPPGIPTHAVVTLGNFDGVHRGHASLVQNAARMAHDLGGAPVLALAFDPHPRTLLGKTLPAPLTTLAGRLDLLRAAGATQVGVLRTSLSLLAWDAETFFQSVMVQSLQARGVVEGDNFCFGRNRQGTIHTLRDFCGHSGISLGVVQAIEAAGQEVSSTRIRQALAEGAVDQACQWLGRPYRLSGVVVPGARRGRVLGFPTANLQPLTVVPAPGVYACRARLADGSVLQAATHIGPAPTFGEELPRVEAHLLDFQGDLYGQTIALEFLARLRDPQTFPSVEALVRQLGMDVRVAQNVCDFHTQRDNLR